MINSVFENYCYYISNTAIFNKKSPEYQLGKCYNATFLRTEFLLFSNSLKNIKTAKYENV